MTRIRSFSGPVATLIVAGGVFGGAACLGPRAALAHERAAEIRVDEPPSPEDLEAYARLARPRGGFARILVHAHFGRGLRFNNPFRLERILGDTERSLSATAPFHNLGLGFAVGDPDGVQHGASLRLSLALEGVSQQAFSLSYLATWQPAAAWVAYGRAGLSALTAPDPNVGGELGLGGVFLFTGALGLNLEAVGSLFYGASSLESDLTPFPILSLQGGLVFNYEVLP
ncbi:MAG: hypothetical protein AAGN82_20305 [Myxococcota bacterium]